MRRAAPYEIGANEAKAAVMLGGLGAATLAGGPIGFVTGIVGIFLSGLGQTSGVGKETFLDAARQASATGGFARADLELFADWFSGDVIDSMTAAERAEMAPLLGLVCATLGPSWRGWPYCHPDLVATTPRPDWPIRVILAGERGPTDPRRSPTPDGRFVQHSGYSADKAHVRHYDTAAHAYARVPGGPIALALAQYVPVTTPAAIGDIWGPQAAAGSPRVAARGPTPAAKTWDRRWFFAPEKGLIPHTPNFVPIAAAVALAAVLLWS